MHCISTFHLQKPFEQKKETIWFNWLLLDTQRATNRPHCPSQRFLAGRDDAGDNCIVLRACSLLDLSWSDTRHHLSLAWHSGKWGCCHEQPREDGSDAVWHLDSLSSEWKASIFTTYTLTRGLFSQLGCIKQSITTCHLHSTNETVGWWNGKKVFWQPSSGRGGDTSESPSAPCGPRGSRGQMSDSNVRFTVS